MINGGYTWREYLFLSADGMLASADGKLIVQKTEDEKWELLKINGYDFSHFVTPDFFEFYSIKVQGQNKGVSMSGTPIFDTIKIRDCFNCKLGLIGESDFRNLFAFSKLDFVEVEYRNPETGLPIKKQMTMTMSKAKEFRTYRGDYFYKNISLSFEEA